MHLYLFPPGAPLNDIGFLKRYICYKKIGTETIMNNILTNGENESRWQNGNELSTAKKEPVCLNRRMAIKIEAAETLKRFKNCRQFVPQKVGTG